METMRRSKSKKKSLTLKKEKPVSVVYKSESTKEVLVPVKKNQGNGKGGGQQERLPPAAKPGQKKQMNADIAN